MRSPKYTPMEQSPFDELFEMELDMKEQTFVESNLIIEEKQASNKNTLHKTNSARRNSTLNKEINNRIRLTLKLLREDKFKDNERKLKTLAAAASLLKDIESILRDEATDGLLLLANAPLGETSSVQRS